MIGNRIDAAINPATTWSAGAWFCLCLTLCILGVAIMITADAQKYFTLRLHPGGALKARDPNPFDVRLNRQASIGKFAPCLCRFAQLTRKLSLRCVPLLNREEANGERAKGSVRSFPPNRLRRNRLPRFSVSDKEKPQMTKCYRTV